MSAQLVYARFPALTHRAAHVWMRAVDDVIACHGGEFVPPPPTGDPRPAIAWRLMSDNHREIGRACRFFATEPLARADMCVLIRHTADLAVHTCAGSRRRTTGWFVTLDRRLVMIGARRYENRSLARNAGTLAVRLFEEMSHVPGEASRGAGVDSRPAWSTRRGI